MSVTDDLSSSEKETLRREFEAELRQAQAELAALADKPEALAIVARRVEILRGALRILQRKTPLETGMSPIDPPVHADIALLDLLDAAARAHLLLRAHATQPMAISDDALLVAELSTPLRLSLRAPGGETIVAPSVDALDAEILAQFGDAAGAFVTTLLNSHQPEARRTIQAALSNGCAIVLTISPAAVRVNLVRAERQVVLGEVRTLLVH